MKQVTAQISYLLISSPAKASKAICYCALDESTREQFQKLFRTDNINTGFLCESDTMKKQSAIMKKVCEGEIQLIFLTKGKRAFIFQNCAQNYTYST